MAMESTDLIGWSAVAVLFATMAGQAWKEWRDRVKHGISKWFFAGQVTTSVLFIVYSAKVGNMIFVVGNTLVLLAALAGGAILMYNKKRR
jgi:MtN3 and saliva related transmembrane protein